MYTISWITKKAFVYAPKKYVLPTGEKIEEKELDKSLCGTAPLQQIEDYYDSSSYIMFLSAFIPSSFFFYNHFSGQKILTPRSNLFGQIF